MLPKRGEAERKLELELGPIDPWRTHVRVHAITTNHGRHSLLPQDRIFEVSADWFGPPAAGFPPSPKPVAGQDVYIVESLERANALARYAAAVFARGGDHPPDLRELDAELRR